MRKNSLLTLLLSLGGVSLTIAAPIVVGDTLPAEAGIMEMSNWQFRYEEAKNGITLTDVVTEGDGKLVIPSTYTLDGVEKEVVAISKDFLHGNDRLT